jgi:3-phenylpropionate/cinnamic acid dioxygenase small subunit
VTTTPHPSTDAVSQMSIAAVVLQHEVEQFLYYEAALLDAHDYDAWLDLFTDDTHYFMPIRRTRMARELGGEFTRPDEMAWFNDTKFQLAGRVIKLRTGRSWAEDPPSRTRHLITNVRVVEDDGNEVAVRSNFHLYRTRLKSEEDSWIGSRHDVLRRTDTGLRIAQRTIYLEQTILLSRNLSSFF